MTFIMKNVSYKRHLGGGLYGDKDNELDRHVGCFYVSSEVTKNLKLLIVILSKLEGEWFYIKSIAMKELIEAWSILDDIGLANKRA